MIIIIEKSAFNDLEKAFLIIVSFIPFLNGLSFAYMGAKEGNNNWIKESLFYELPWFLLFLSVNNDSLGSIFAGLGLLFMLICIVRTIWVAFRHKKVYENYSQYQSSNKKSSSSFWIIFSIIICLNGLGLIIVGLRRNVKQWILEGALVEFLWIIYFSVIYADESILNFVISIVFIAWVLSIFRTILIYFEEKRMDNMDLNGSPEPVIDSPEMNLSQKPVENAVSSEIIPQFRPYNIQINDLKNTFNQKEANVTKLINQRFHDGELSYERFMSVMNSCHKIFYHHADSASSIIELASDYSERLDEAVKEKIGILESINDEMNNLIEELIIHDGNEDGSEEELNELFSNMDDLINSVKDYK